MKVYKLLRVFQCSYVYSRFSGMICTLIFVENVLYRQAYNTFILTWSYMKIGLPFTPRLVK